jgi:hypothetical protein
MIRSPSAASGFDRRSRLLAVLAVASGAAFAAGCLVTQLVIVPGWRAMGPAESLAAFRAQGPVLGATIFPFELAATVVQSASAIRAFRAGAPGRLLWAGAASAVAATVVLLPVYFIGANVALLDPTFPVPAVPAALADWNSWNWRRTGLGVLAAVLACGATVRADIATTTERAT